MSIVHVLYESLDSATLGNLFLAHALCDLPGRSFNSSHNAMWELPALLNTFVVLLDDNGLLSSMSSCENDYNSSWF